MARTPFKMKSGNSPLYKKLGDKPKLPTAVQDNTRVANRGEISITPKKTKYFKKDNSIPTAQFRDNPYSSSKDSLPSNYSERNATVDALDAYAPTKRGHESAVRAAKFKKGMIKRKTNIERLSGQ